jgi:hypothetical protein
LTVLQKSTFEAKKTAVPAKSSSSPTRAAGVLWLPNQNGCPSTRIGSVCVVAKYPGPIPLLEYYTFAHSVARISNASLSGPPLRQHRADYCVWVAHSS